MVSSNVKQKWDSSSPASKLATVLIMATTALNSGDLYEIARDTFMHGPLGQRALPHPVETDLGLAFVRQNTTAATLGIIGKTIHETRTVYPEAGIACTSTHGTKHSWVILTSDIPASHNCVSLSQDWDLSDAYHRKLIENYAINHTRATGESVRPFTIYDTETGETYPAKVTFTPLAPSS